MVRESITKSLAIMENQIVEAYLVKLSRYREDISPQVSIKTVVSELQNISPIRENPTSSSPELNKTQVINQGTDGTSPVVKVAMPDSETHVRTEKLGIFMSIKRFFSGILPKK